MIAYWLCTQDNPPEQFEKYEDLVTKVVREHIDTYMILEGRYLCERIPPGEITSLRLRGDQ
jgi:hypothetical protein